MTNSNGHGGSALPLDERKRAARARAKRLMAGCDRDAASAALAERVWPLIQPGGTVAGFHPMGPELDVTGLLRRAREAGCVVALPRTPGLGLPLTFHRWADSDALVPERFGTMTSDGPAVRPDTLLVPLLAFDRRGNRLGYGGGYYDRTIATMPGVRTVGCAYAVLELPEVPTGPTDRTLDWVATEDELIRVGPCASCS